MLAPVAARANVCMTVASGAWSAPAVWLSGILPQAGDTAIIGAGDSVGLDRSTPMLAFITVNGFLYLGGDTLFLSAPANDTSVILRGTLDAANGWFADSLRAIIHCLAGSRFRTSAVFPLASPSIFDSTQSPFFTLDSGSTFEYYSENLDKIDISYLLNNVAGHAYQNLTLTEMNASYHANPLIVNGTLTIGFGASMLADYVPDTITILGDVVNQDQGQDGAAGAGLHGCGMLSLGFDTWIFNGDTDRWSGPSQLGNVIVRPNTVLSVRFVSDTLCDSLDVLNSFVEDSAPCGGYLIGRVYSETPFVFSAGNPVDTFAGMVIRSGVPYLGHTRIVRTTGYPPPGANPEHAPVLRYYYISPGDGPQSISPDTISMQVHCDEWNGSHATLLHFWRSLDRGATWAYSGLTTYSSKTNTFSWDTTVLGWPNDSGGFFWMLSEGYMDTPLPVELEYFTAEESDDCVSLAWKTGSETNLAGFELDRFCGNDSEVIASYWNDDSLRSHSGFGAKYSYTDAKPPRDSLRYDLYEVTQDGLRNWLASRTPSEAPEPAPLSLGNPAYTNGVLNASFSSPEDGTIRLLDALGRTIFLKSMGEGSGNVIIPITLLQGAYFLEARCDEHRIVSKLIVP